MRVYDEIKKQAPILASIKKQMGKDPGEPYYIDMQEKVMERLGIKIEDAPEGYFEEVKSTIDKKVQKPTIITLKTALSIAASLIILISAVWIYQGNNTQKETAIDNELALYFLELQTEDLSLDEIADLAIAQNIEITPWEENYMEGSEELYLEELNVDDVDDTFLANTIFE